MQSKSKRRLAWLIGGVAVVGLGVGVYAGLGGDDAGAPQYETAAVVRGRVSARVTATGTLSPLVTVQVGSQVSGRLHEILVDFNSQVSKGQVLARLDPRLFAAEVAKARANLEVAQATVKRAEAELADAKRRHERAATLAQGKLVAQAEADTALAAVESADAQVTAARAGRAQASAALEQAETNLAFTTIVSPIDGIVITRSVDVGQTVAASLQAPTLFTIAEDLRKMEVHTNVAEADVGRVRPEMKVEFVVDAHPTERFRGVVKEVRYSPQTVQNVVTYDAVVSVDNSELRLRPGMTASVTFLVEEREDALLVPNAALRFRPPPEATAAPVPKPEGRRERVIFTADQAGKVVPALVEAGISDGRNTEVVRGLSEGDRVVVGVSGATPAAPAAPRFGRIL